MVAATTRTSTLMLSLPPTRRTSLSCSARSSLACISSGRSPISSRKSVPPSVSSKSPSLRASAPVKAPRSWPNSSLSKSCSGIAEQFSGVKGFLRRGLLKWIARATSSLPVPLSPRTSTVAGEGAILRRTSSACAIFGERPTIPSMRTRPKSWSCSRRFSLSSAARSAARRTVSSSVSLSSGLAR